MMFQIGSDVSVGAAIEQLWSVLIFTWKFRNIPFFNEMNRSIGDIIQSFIGSLITYLCSLGKNPKDFVIFLRVTS